MDFSAEQSPGDLAKQLSRLYTRNLLARLVPLGLNVGMFMTLRELWAQDGAQQRDISRRLQLEQAAMTRMLQRMERENLLRRQMSPLDGRKRAVYLTDKGRALREPAMRAAREQNDAALSSLSREQRLAFCDAMLTVIRVLEED
ncbi:MAG: MarR family transcriptional regulator [Geminicoccaceae bacterium]|nr:MarR family transcriptional regulator [Geminicoccaceae bacterium]